MYVADVREQMMNDMVIESTEKEIDERTIRRKVGSRNNLMVRPTMWQAIMCIRLWEIRIFSNVCTEKNERNCQTSNNS